MNADSLLEIIQIIYSTDEAPKTFPTGSCVTTSIHISWGLTISILHIYITLFSKEERRTGILVPITYPYITGFFRVSYFCTSPVISVLISMAEETHKIQTTQKEKPDHNHNREQVLQPTEKPQESKEVGLEDEETEQDRTSKQSRSGGRGKPPRRVIEEWANDPYCE